MTDLEMTKLCADAMGIGVTIQPDSVLTDGSPYPGFCKLNEPEGDGSPSGTIWFYDPLHDDAQAMALVKRFPSECLFRMHFAYMQSQQLHPIPMDLNYAIVRGVIDEMAKEQSRV